MSGESSGDCSQSFGAEGDIQLGAEPQEQLHMNPMSASPQLVLQNPGEHNFLKTVWKTSRTGQLVISSDTQGHPFSLLTELLPDSLDLSLETGSC